MIRFDHVSKSFAKSTVLSNVTGAVPHGKIVTIVGPSGSGKSTLLSLCNLLLTPDEGEVFVDGKEVRAWNIGELRRFVGLVFQTPTMFPGSVLDNIEIGLKLKQQEIRNPGQHLQNVGLSADLLYSEAESLSGGQKQRVALARVLANRPKVLLLDEVTSALDPTTARNVEELILSIHGKNNTTVVWVTHNLEQAKRVGDITWLLVNGKLVEAAQTEHFFKNPVKEMTRRFLSGNGGNGSE